MRAFVFDLDGTLIDSERAIVHAASRAFLDVGVSVTELQVADHLGAPLEELYGLFVGDGDEPRMRRFVASYIAVHDAHPDRFPPPLPGVREGLSLLRDRFLLAVATTKPSERAVSQLAGCGLSTTFGHIQGTDPGMRPKPAPDVVVRACAALGVDPKDAVMVGDTPRDIQAARAAGCGAVAIAYSDERARAASSFGADRVVRTISELDALSKR